MDINITAPGHSNQKQLIKYYRTKLISKYGSYDFIKTVEVKVKSLTENEVSVALQLRLEKGPDLYASHENANENKALSEVIRKMHSQIEKYKQLHYHSVHSIKRNHNSKKSIEE